MSDINNKHIPEDLDSLTRKDMVELFNIQIEEHQGFIKEIESLREKLANANERVEKLTSYIRIIATTPSAPQTICPNEPIDPRKSRDDYISEAWYYLEQLRKGQE